MTTLFVVGVSHKTAPLEVRESLAVPKERMAEALARFRLDANLAEAMILSTCNRVEVYARGAEGSSAEMLIACFAGFHGRSVADLQPFLYGFSGEAAVRHAFRVAASLDSQVLGEPQILGQVKEAYQAAASAESLGGGLNALRDRSLAAARRARTETSIGQNAVSVSYVAVELARKIFGSLREKNVLIVGAGKMTTLAARHLVRNGARATVLGGRTFERATELAAVLGGRAVPLEGLRGELAEADIVISGTGASGLVVRREDVESARQSRRRPLFLIDIAVPRDIEASVRSLEGVFLYDLDDLKAVAEANLRERQKEAAAAEAIVSEEVQQFLSWQKSMEAAPIVAALRQRAEAIRQDELARARKRLGSLTSEQEAALESATLALVNKLLHAPTTQIKELSKNGHAAQSLDLVRKLFGL
jgi:glutamyl-tRNA reductase